LSRKVGCNESRGEGKDTVEVETERSDPDETDKELEKAGDCGTVFILVRSVNCSRTI
jgi:hypothetical protein